MGVFTKSNVGLNACVFSFDDCLELGYEQLLGVNGGCGIGYSRTSSSGSCGGGYGSGAGYSSTNSTSGSCGGISIRSVSNINGSCGGGSVSSVFNSNGACGNGKSLLYQTPSNPNDYHCDIIAYNQAVDHGEENLGAWDGNALTVDQIYKNYYEGQGTDNSVKKNSSGYVFYDWNNDGTYDHMEYYTAGNNSKYTVYETDGITNPVAITYDSKIDNNGHASKGTATFVSLN